MFRTLEITVISAEDLRVHRRPVRKNAFAVVKTDMFDVRTSNSDEFGGSYPTWNEMFEMKMEMNGIREQFILIEVFRRTGSGRDKKIGDTKIPVKDFIGGYAPEGHLNFLSYRLWDVWGDRNGIVNVTVRVKPEATRFGVFQRTPEKKVDYGAGACASQAAGFWRSAVPETGIPVGALPAGGYGGRMVPGVPIWCACQTRNC